MAQQVVESRLIPAMLLGGFGLAWVVGLLIWEETPRHQPDAAVVKVIVPAAPAPSATSASATESEDKSCQSSEAQRNAAAKAIRAAGYDCFAADSVCPYLFSEGFTVACNHNRYLFEIENHGGRWSVTAR